MEKLPLFVFCYRSLLDFLDYFGVYLYGVHSSVADSEQAANVIYLLCNVCKFDVSPISLLFKGK